MDASVMDPQVQSVVEQIKPLKISQMGSILMQVQQLKAAKEQTRDATQQAQASADAEARRLAALAAADPKNPMYVSSFGNPMKWTRSRALEAINAAVLAQPDKGKFGTINGPYENVRQYIKNNTGRNAMVSRNENAPYTYSGGRRRRRRTRRR